MGEESVFETNKQKLVEMMKFKEEILIKLIIPFEKYFTILSNFQNAERLEYTKQ
jgi:hypothetical protein